MQGNHGQAMVSIAYPPFMVSDCGKKNGKPSQI